MSIGAYTSSSPAALWPLSEIVSCPGSMAVDIRDSQFGDGRQVGARLRRLREAGLVEAHGRSPAHWYPTEAGRRAVSRQRLGMLRDRAREARGQMIEKLARAEALYAFADTLTYPALQPLLCPPPRHRTLSFGELADTLRQSEGCDVSVFDRRRTHLATSSTDHRDRRHRQRHRGTRLGTR